MDYTDIKLYTLNSMALFVSLTDLEPILKIVQQGAKTWVATSKSLYYITYDAVAPFGMTLTKDVVSGTPVASSYNLDICQFAVGTSNYLCAVHYNDTFKYFNGTTWTQRTSSFGTSSIFAVTATSGGRFFACGESGKFAFSDNGTTWSQSFPTSSFGASTVRAVDISPDGTYIAGGASGKLATSFDGVTWIQRDSGFGTSTINGVYIDNNNGLAVGAAGKITYSV